jgi:hypothetical protein
VERKILTSLLTTDAKKGQAMLETVLLIPFVVVMIFFIYQAYITVNRVGVVQKYLKSHVIGMLMNRYEVTAENLSIIHGAHKTPADGQYFYIYNEYGSGGAEGMNAGLDGSTAAILLTFMSSSGDRAGLESRLTAGIVSKQALGICLGGGSVMANQVSTDVLSMQEGQTCGQK